MFPIRDCFQEHIETPLNDFFQSLKTKRQCDLEDLLISKYKTHQERYPGNAFPVIQVNFVFINGKHEIVYLDRFGDLKINGMIRDRTKNVLIVLQSTLDWVNNNKLSESLGKRSFSMYFDLSDTYYEEFSGFPIFAQAKLKTVDLPLYPDYTYFRMSFIPDGKIYNWDESKEIFKRYRTEKPPIEDKPFFRGVDSTSNPLGGGDNSNIRKGLCELSTKDKETSIKVFDNTESSRKSVPLFQDCGFKTYIDLPGNFPWSYRKKFLYLTGGDVVYVRSLWNGDCYGWEQFIDKVLEPLKTHEIDFIYNVGRDNSENIRDLYEKIKVCEKIDQTTIDKRLERLENLNMDRLYQYMAKALVWCSKYE